MRQVLLLEMHESPQAFPLEQYLQQTLGTDAAVGRSVGVGHGVAVGVGRAVAVGVGRAVAVGVRRAVAVGVGRAVAVGTIVGTKPIVGVGSEPHANTASRTAATIRAFTIKVLLRSYSSPRHKRTKPLERRRFSRIPSPRPTGAGDTNNTIT